MTANNTSNSEITHQKAEMLTCPYHHCAIYAGNVRHRRFGIKSHAFNYRLYMLALDLDEVIKY